MSSKRRCSLRWLLYLVVGLVLAPGRVFSQTLPQLIEGA
jgi:hypothetical protein